MFIGEDEREKKKRIKAEEAVKKWEDHKEATDQAKAEPKSVRTPLEKWELSLHSCTSLSQLYVHLALLDNSITWNRSVMNARCRICRRKGDPDKMLLCDGCDKGHHMYCLKPPISTIPDGDWYVHGFQMLSADTKALFSSSVHFIQVLLGVQAS